MGSAAAARGVVGKLSPALFLVSLVFLGYSHYLVWGRRTGHGTARWVLLVNTVLVGLLWYGRVKQWVGPWLGWL